jgi:alcohol dehydrogenase
MKAVKIHEYGGVEALKYEDSPMPSLEEGEVMIEVHAASLNPIDTKLINGATPQQIIQFPITPGYDVAGIIQHIGHDVEHVKIGECVYGQAGIMQSGSGSFAEYAVTSSDLVAKMPNNLSFNEAAAVPLAACSAYQALVETMNIHNGQKILIHGGSGGVGTFAIQLARHAGAYVAATATGKGIEYIKQQGVNEAVDYNAETPFEDKIKDFDFVLDTVGNETYHRSFRTLKKGGLIVSLLSNPDKALMAKYDVRSLFQVTKVTTEKLDEVTKLIEGGFLKVNIAKIFPLEETKKAYETKENEQVLGKIAIEIQK